LIDKWLHYFHIYDKWFKDFRGTDLVFVEIGVQNGGSLQMWKDYFGKDAKIIGIDIDERCKAFEEDQISIEIGSQESVEFWNGFKKKYPRVDILLDDGGHTMQQQIVTFQQMFPHIKDGGIYMCEDCHTSYREEYGGGGLKPGTYIEFTKVLVDVINAFHTKGAMPPNYFTVNMGGIHFYDSIVVVEKFNHELPPMSFKVGKPSF
ncbi:MAG: class I SAM-dependent methyltransferase, partial [Selenomonadaceae bacterium]|nr:class I SAM-dependent methyltransferase [Selenomonadaceae bacterium]